MFSKEKGITPVIAIVLLLLITVGAVGVVYTQFQDLTSGGNQEEQLQNQQRLQSASYNIIGVEKRTSGGNEYFNIQVKNTANDVTLNLTESSTMQMGVDGGSVQPVNLRGNQPCDWQPTDSPTPGETVTCETTVEWPSDLGDGKREQVRLLVDGTEKDSYTCDAEQDFC